MKVTSANMIIALVILLAFVQAAIAATPVSVTVWETSGVVTAQTFLLTDPRLNQVRALPLSQANSDFVGVVSQFKEPYDIYRSTATGAASTSGGCFTIVGQWNGTGDGFNIARVDLNMSDTTVQYFSSLTAFTMGTSGGLFGSELNAVDTSTATATALGGATGQNPMRIVVCKPIDLYPPPENPCCPPWDATRLADHLFYRGGPIAGTYTLEFQADAQLKGGMQAYIEYLNSTNPAMTLIIIDFTLYDQGIPPVPAGLGNGTQIGINYFLTWMANGPSNGIVEPINAGPVFFPSFPMQVGHQYLVHTGIYLNNGLRFFPDECSNVDVYVTLDVRKKTGPSSPNPILELKTKKGNLLRQVEIKSKVETRR